MKPPKHLNIGSTYQKFHLSVKYSKDNKFKAPVEFVSLYEKSKYIPFHLCTVPLMHRSTYAPFHLYTVPFMHRSTYTHGPQNQGLGGLEPRHNFAKNSTLLKRSHCIETLFELKKTKKHTGVLQVVNTFVIEAF